MNETKALAILNQPLPKVTRAVDICETYRKIKPSVEAAIFLVAFIPVYGKQIAAVIKLLAQVADQACSG